jgi:hypothetical protein
VRLIVERRNVYELPGRLDRRIGSPRYGSRLCKLAERICGGFVEPGALDRQPFVKSLGAEIKTLAELAAPQGARRRQDHFVTATNSRLETPQIDIDGVELQRDCASIVYKNLSSIGPKLPPKHEEHLAQRMARLRLIAVPEKACQTVALSTSVRLGCDIGKQRPALGPDARNGPSFRRLKADGAEEQEP